MYFGNQRVFHVYHTEYKDTPTQEKNLDITENGEYEVTPDEKLLLSKVIINANVKTPVNLEDKEITENGTYTASEGYDGIGEVVVNIPEIPTQEKTIEITENGITEIFPDEGYTLSRVVAIANVGGGENKFAQLVDDTLTEITAEDLEGATKIRKYAFYNDIVLQNITIPNSITSIESSAFHKCSNLTSVIIPNSVTSIGSGAFFTCSSLISINIPDSVITLGSDCFRDSALTSVSLGNGLTELSSGVFAMCSRLLNITIPANITSIKGWALEIGGTTAGNKATFTFLSSTPPSIASNTFYAPKIEKIIVPAGSGEAYKTATNWANFADYIEEAAV